MGQVLYLLGQCSAAILGSTPRSQVLRPFDHFSMMSASALRFREFSGTSNVPRSQSIALFQKSLSLSGSRSGDFISAYRAFNRQVAAYCDKPFRLIQKRGTMMATLETPSVIEQDQVPLLRKLLGSMVKPYLNKNPTAGAALELIRTQLAGRVCYDHFAFRTFGVHGCGIDSIAQVFLDLGYSTRDELRFPAKKLRALWFSPAEHLYDVKGELEDGPLPRIFISEILVDQLSIASQTIIHKYTKSAGLLARHAATASALDTLTWPTPSLADYQVLASESEYAAWTLAHGYALNHATVSVHRVPASIDALNNFLQDGGITLNSEGGILKVSPDGGLLQSSSVADSVQYVFADGEVRKIPASYIEFAERLVSPVYSDVKEDKLLECHRRDGFEVGNADKIFESTSFAQTGFGVS